MSDELNFYSWGRFSCQVWLVEVDMGTQAMSVENYDFFCFSDAEFSSERQEGEVFRFICHDWSSRLYSTKSQSYYGSWQHRCPQPEITKLNHTNYFLQLEFLNLQLSGIRVFAPFQDVTPVQLEIKIHSAKEIEEPKKFTPLFPFLSV